MTDKAGGHFVYILLLNWNGWKDTIECLESIFHGNYPECRVIVCDNASEDNSIEHIKAWAEGRLDCAIPENKPMRRYSFPPVAKPVRYVQYDRVHAEAGGDPADRDARLVLIQTGSNLGFAGGNNVGLRYALARDDFRYVWMLNNDTVVKADALAQLVRHMERTPAAGLCGSTLFYYRNPEAVQTLGGGTFNKWLALSHHIGASGPAGRSFETGTAASRMDYVVGASMLVTNGFLRDIGLMCEDYFLYFEDNDWAMRARGRYDLTYAPESVVYHKEGGSIGSSSISSEKSPLADYFGFRNRLLFTRKFFPRALCTVYLGLFASIVRRALRGEWKRVTMGIAAVVAPNDKLSAVIEELRPKREEQF